MGKMKDGIFKRGGSVNYQLRRRIPNDVRHAFGNRAHRQETLDTPDLAEARRKARAKGLEWDLLDQAARDAALSDKATVRPPPLTVVSSRNLREATAHDMKVAAAEYFHAQLNDDAVQRRKWASAADLDKAKQELLERMRSEGVDSTQPLAFNMMALDYLALANAPDAYRELREFRLKTLTDHMNKGETALVSYAAEDFIERYGLKIGRGSPAFKDLCRHIARGEIEFLKTTFAWDRGDYGYRPVDPAVDPELRPIDPTTFEDIIVRQEELSKKRIGGRKAPATARKYRTAVEQFCTWRNSTIASTVTVEELERWRDHLLEGGSNTKTCRDKVAAIRAVANWGSQQTKGKLFGGKFPLIHLQLPVAEKKSSADVTYTVTQAQKILRAARKRTKPHDRWIVWLQAYSGARVSEIAALERRDIFQHGDDWFMCLRVEGEARTNKTMKMRNVPIHAAIIAEGFLEFVSSVTAGPLFPSNQAEQDVRKWIRDDVMKDVPKPKPQPTHGFRHLFEDLRFTRLSHEAALYIAGRSSPTSDRLYGKSTQMLPALAAEMRKFPDIMQLDP